MKSQPHSFALDRQINDYLLTASGQLRETRAASIDARRAVFYGAAAGSALVLMSQAEAAVVANAGTARPVTVVGSSSVQFASFDMNGDSIPDFQLFGYSYRNYYSAYSAGLNGTPGGANNSVLGRGKVRKLASGVAIGPTPPVSSNWQTAVGENRDVFFGQGNGASNWSGSSGETGFAGVRFKINGATHYGWIKLQLNQAGSLSATAWAFESCPDTPINAGQTTGGANCNPAAPIPATGPLALGLAALALGGLGLASLRRRRDARRSS